MRILSIVFTVFLFAGVSGQSNLSFTLVDSVRVYSNLTITTQQLDEIFTQHFEAVSKLKFQNCTFSDEDAVLDGLYIPVRWHNLPTLNKAPVSSPVEFNACTFIDFTFDSYIFSKPVKFENINGQSLSFSNSQFLSALSFERCIQTSVMANNSSFDQVKFNLFQGTAEFSFSKFPKGWFQTDANSLFQLLSFSGCDFFGKEIFKEQKNKRIYENSFNLTYLNAEHLEISGCTFNSVLYLFDVSVSKTFVFQNNRVDKALSFDGIVDLPLFNSRLRYSDIRDKIFTEYAYDYTDETSNFYLLDYASLDDFGNKGELYSPAYSTEPFYSDPSKVISIYSKFLTIFRNNSDNDSYNECYKKLKTIEKIASQVAFADSPSIENFFAWKMNQFLDTFCDYGTNPVKSLVFSFWVILAFCIVYALFPSEEDNLRYDRLKGAISRYVHHFANRTNLKEETRLAYEAEMAGIKQLGDELKSNKASLPGIVHLFGNRLHRFMLWWAKVRYKLKEFVEFNIYSDWHTLNNMSKLRMSAIITFSLSFFLFWGLIMRLINAITLSMNAFVTLGYGEIAASGVARYFCVLEGLVGWFLLSIFSVSLISQILQ